MRSVRQSLNSVGLLRRAQAGVLLKRLQAESQETAKKRAFRVVFERGFTRDRR
jgi:hypothetical protein